MAASKTNAPVPFHKHHYVRTFFASLFGFFALGLIVMSILVVWLDHTLTNTDQYVKTVTPLVSKPEVQDFVVSKASDSLLDNNDAPIRDIATQLLGADKIEGKSDQQLKIELAPIIKESLRSVVSSPAFAKLWETNNRNIHGQLMAQLKSNSDTISLDFHPLVAGLIDQLGSTKLSFVKDKFELKPGDGTVTITGNKLQTVRSVYDYFKKAMIALIACAVLASVLCVLISVHHLKTTRRIALSTGIYCAVLAIVLSAASLIKLGGPDAEMQKLAVALVDAVTHDLRIGLIVIAILGIGGSIGSKVYAHVSAKKPAPAKA